MAIGEDALDGLDLSVLQNITVDPTESAKKEEDTGGEPSIFEPQLKIQEVDEVPEVEAKEEVKIKEEPQEEESDVKDEVPEAKAENKEEPVSEATEQVEEEEETSNAFRVFAEMQRDKGLIDYNDDDFEENDDWLFSRISDTIESKVNEYNH